MVGTHVDPARFAVHAASPRGFAQAYVRENVGGVPPVCVHGWPETKRVFWKAIEPLAAAGFALLSLVLVGFLRPAEVPVVATEPKVVEEAKEEVVVAA